MKIQQKTLLVLFGIFAISLVVPAIKPLIYLILAVHALRGAKETIEAFSLLFIILMGNPAIFGTSGTGLRWVVILMGFAGTFWRMIRKGGSNQTDSNIITIWLFFLILFPISILTSKVPSVSTFKLISFFIGALTVFHCFRTTRQLQEYWKHWFYTIFVFLILASLLTFPLGYGFLRNGRGFQGIFNHPQTLGPVCGILGAWFMGEYIFSKNKKNLTVLLLGGTSIVFIFLSLARLGLAMLGGSFILAYLISYLSGRRVIIPPFGQWIIFLSTLAFIFMAIYDYESISNFIGGFIQKREPTADLNAAFYESRGFLIEASMSNFWQYPLLGIGFGVPTDYLAGFGNIETFMGIPIGASVEKGFFPSALLEEVGLFGTLITLILVISIISNVNRKGNFPLLWLVNTVLLLNIGEAVFFSFGGLGLFDWLMFGFCYNQALDANNNLSPSRFKPKVQSYDSLHMT